MNPTPTSSPLRSLVALDELGRGTATLDGAAIAGAVLQYMAHDVGCRCGSAERLIVEMNETIILMRTSSVIGQLTIVWYPSHMRYSSPWRPLNSITYHRS